jgi:hypothetical protein
MGLYIGLHWILRIIRHQTHTFLCFWVAGLVSSNISPSFTHSTPFSTSLVSWINDTMCLCTCCCFMGFKCKSCRKLNSSVLVANWIQFSPISYFWLFHLLHTFESFDACAKDFFFHELGKSTGESKWILNPFIKYTINFI